MRGREWNLERFVSLPFLTFDPSERWITILTFVMTSRCDSGVVTIHSTRSALPGWAALTTSTLVERSLCDPEVATLHSTRSASRGQAAYKHANCCMRPCCPALRLAMICRLAWQHGNTVARLVRCSYSLVAITCWTTQQALNLRSGRP